MSEYHDESGVSRRNFLRAASLTAVAAAATGSGAAFLLRSNQKPVVITAIDPPPAPTAAPTTATLPQGAVQSIAQPAEDVNATLARLAESQAENMRLQAELAAVRRDLDAARAAEQTALSDRDALAGNLDQANNRLGVLGGLVALYEQLDRVDVTDAVENGLAALGQQLGELVDGLPELSSGLQTGQLALSDVEAHLPLLENGRQWLTAQVERLEGFYNRIELVLQEVVERVGTFLEMLGDWFEGLRRWLPFGIGERAAAVMSALTALLAETPNTVSGLNVNIAQPLDFWLARQDDEPALKRTLVKPLREEVIGRAWQTIDRANLVQAAYQQALINPTQPLLNDRKSLRQTIEDYRGQHQI